MRKSNLIQWFDDAEKSSSKKLNMVMKSNLQIQVKIEHEQKNLVFHTRGKVSGILCDTIIHAGSMSGCVSMDFVNLLALTTMKHSCPYDLGFLRKGNKVVVRC